MWRHTRRKQISSFGRNGRVHLNRQADVSTVDYWPAEVCASAVVMLDTPCSEVVWRVLATHSITPVSPSLLLPCVTVCHHISTWLYNTENKGRESLLKPLPIYQTSRHHTADDRKAESTYLRKYIHLRVYRPYGTRGNALGYPITFQLC